MNGNLGSSFETKGQLRRAGHIGAQMQFNMNPDNFFDSINGCWTSDPQCGLQIAPKRPWEVLKNPRDHMFKLERDHDVSQRALIGWFKN